MDGVPEIVSDSIVPEPTDAFEGWGVMVVDVIIVVAPTTEPPRGAANVSRASYGAPPGSRG
jgi:hypothetical protein